MGGKEEQDWLNQAANNKFEYTSTNRIIAVGNLGAKNTHLIDTLTKTIDNIEKIPTEKINQLSSVMDQMTKIIEDIMEDK